MMNIFYKFTGQILIATIFYILTVPVVHAALLMHLPLDGNLNDASGNGNNASFPGGSSNPAYTSAVFNQGLNFDGNNDYILVPSFDPGSTFSASLWVNHDSIGALNTFIEHVQNGNNRNDFYIGYDNSNNSLTVELEDTNALEGGACGDPKFCTGISLNSNRWYHIVVTVTPTTLKVYIDSVLAYSTTHNTTVNFGNGTWMLGADTDRNPVTVQNSDQLDGRLDDVRIYNHELSQTEVSTLYGLVANWTMDDCNLSSAGDIKDVSGNGINANPVNGITTATGKICTALSLDGVNDYAEVPYTNALDLPNTLTVMAWIRPRSIPSSGLKSIVSKDENYEFHIDSSGRIYWWWNNSAGNTRSFTSTTTIPTNTWTHVAIVYEPGSQRIVINGVERGTRNYNETLLTNTDPLHIGADQFFAGREFDGLIDEVRIYRRALPTEEINGYYNNPDPTNRSCPSCGSSAQNLIISTDQTETLGSLTFSDGSLAEYNATLNSASLYFNENLFSANEDINAVHVLANGVIILSTTGNATLGGLSFGDDDLVAYDPSTDTATLYFDGGANFSNGNEDIDAVHILDDGRIILSTTGNARLGGLNFGDDDLVAYDPVTKTASLYFDGGNLFSNTNEDIDGVYIMSNGHILLSTTGSATLAGTTFSDGSIVEYDPVANTASVYFDENRFSGNADINALTLKPVSTPFHHLEFIHDGNAVTCNAEDITVKACANANCTTPLYPNIVSVTLSPTGWVSGDSKTFTGSANYRLKHTVAETVTLSTSSISPTPSNANVCKDSAGNVISCDLVFSSSGFIFNNETDGNTTIPVQLSGKPSDTGYNAKTITLQAVRASDNDPSQCLPAFQNQTLNIDFAAECKNPSSCIAGKLFNLTSATVTGDLTATNNDNGAAGSSSYDTRSIAFDANGKATISFTYPEAGAMELHARHNILLADGTTPSGNYMSGSASFVVRPFAFYTTITGNPAASSAAGSAFTTAGTDFTVNVRGVAWQQADDDGNPSGTANDGIADGHEATDTNPANNADLSDNPITLNYGQESTIEQVVLNSLLNQPSPGTDPGLGDSSANGRRITSFNIANGTGSSSTINFPEVGIIEIYSNVNDGDYLGIGATETAKLLGRSGYVGRFYPHHFETLVTHGCSGGSSFTYSGQPFTVTAYARNLFNATAQNYRDAFAFGTALSDATVPATANGSFSNNSITSFTAGIGTQSTISYTFNSKETEPYNLAIRATDTTDTAISSNGYTEGSTEIRSGRTRVQNTFGSELVDLAVTAGVEYYTSGDFAVNTADTCTTIDVVLSDIGTDPITLGTGNGQTCLWDDAGNSIGTTDFTCTADASKPQFSEPPSSGSFNINLKAPGAGFTGDIGVSLTSPAWLKFDWDGDGNHDNDPLGTASFGIYRGDDRIIHWREVF